MDSVIESGVTPTFNDQEVLVINFVIRIWPRQGRSGMSLRSRRVKILSVSTTEDIHGPN